MALRYFVNGGVDNNWGTTGNWSLTSGGAGGQTVPTSADDVLFDANSPNCTVNASARVAKTLVFTGYTNTITMSNGITVSGNITLGSGMSFLGTSEITVNATSTITSNGKTIPSFGIAGSNLIHTLADAMVISENFTSNASSTFGQINGFSITIGGNCTNITSAYFGGTTGIILNGTGTLSGIFQNASITFNTLGTITFGTTLTVNACNVVYTLGTLSNTSNCALTVGGTQNLNFNGQTFLSINPLVSVTWNCTLGSNLFTGNFTHTGNSGITLTGQNLYISGNFSLGLVTAAFSGTTNLIFNGTGFISMPNITTGFISNNLTFDTSGTITLSNSLSYRTRTLTYTSGTIDTTTNNSTLNIGASTTLNTNGINWNNVTISAGTQTLTSDLNILNLTIGSTINNSGGDIYINGNLTVSAGIATKGTAIVNLIGTGVWSGTNLYHDLIFNMNLGLITITGTTRIGGTSGSFTNTYKSGKIKNNGILLINGTQTFLNFNKCPLTNILIGGGATITMNEFFTGTPNIPCIVASSGGTYTLTFQDNFEKIAKFVNISGCTLSRPLQLLVLTNSKKSSTNIGLRYINQSPNGIAKNEPSTLVQNTYGTQMLLNDPAIR